MSPLEAIPPVSTLTRTGSGASGVITHLHLDPVGGLSGDMFLAAALDTFPDLATGLEGAMRAAGLPDDWRVTHGPAKDHAMTGTRLAIVPPETGKSRPTGTFLEIKRRLEHSSLPGAVSSRAVQIFGLLAEAEAKVHGVPIDKVHFHEIADWDSVADIVGAAFVIEELAGATWSVAPLPLGGGRIQTSHGPLPVPAPATAELLKGFPVLDDGVGGERVTPTGAAILKALTPGGGLPGGHFSLEAAGQGFGTRKLEGMANMLRLLAYRSDADAPGQERVSVIHFEVDDQSPEDLASGLRALAALPGVRDVCQWPIYGKKGRLATSIQIICDPDERATVTEACFLQTTTIGLRYHDEARSVLSRTVRSASYDGRVVTLKEVVRPGGRRTLKIEADDVAEHAPTQLERAELRRRLEHIDDG